MKYTLGMIFTLLVVLGSAGSVSAQETPQWNVVCPDESNPQTCRMEQNHFIERTSSDGQKKAAKILGVTLIYLPDKKTGERRPHMSIQIPLGVDLRAGMIYRIDKGEQKNHPFLRCTKAGCDAAFQVDETLLEAMLGGTEMLIGFRGWGAQQVTVVKVTLIGFTKAFSALG